MVTIPPMVKIRLAVHVFLAITLSTVYIFNVIRKPELVPGLVAAQRLFTTFPYSIPITICQNISNVITSQLNSKMVPSCSQLVHPVYGFDTQVQKACSFIKNCLPRLCNYGIIVVKFEQLTI